MFTDRAEAGKLLAKKLSTYAGKDAVVLALPRGGVVTGREVARALSLPLDIVAVRKVGHPESPEYAVGAVDEHGTTIMNEAEVHTIDTQRLAEETRRQQQEALRRSTLYRGGRAPVSVEGKIVIIVDDGIATGLTMRLAVRCVKTRHPSRIVVAVPVAPQDAIRALKAEGADEVVALEPPEEFMGAIGAHYGQFEQVEDTEVIRLLRPLPGVS